jgi:stress response protein YsnF
VEEIVIVERRLLFKEEVHIRRVRQTAQHVETVALRRQEAVVTRTPIATADETPVSIDNQLTTSGTSRP